MKSSVAAVAVVAVVAAVTADVNQETAVVEVGPSTITAADILVHADRLLLVEPTGDELADRRKLIQPIVDGRLMALEARARGLDDETLERQFQRLERDRLVSQLERVEIRERIVVDESEIEEAVRRSGLVLYLRHLESEDRAAAESLLARISAGESFADLARARSRAEENAGRGGALPPVRWGQLPPAIEDIAFELTPGEIGGPIAARGRWHLIRLDSLAATGADPDSLRESATRTLEQARFNSGQIRFLAEMKEKLHYAADDSVIARFLARMNEWQDAGAPDSATTPGRDRFGFTAEERALPIFTYDVPLDAGELGHGTFTIGAYSDYMADQPAARVRTRTARERVERDLDQYFRHHAYSDVARARGYLSGIEPDISRLRERSLVGRLSFVEVALRSPPAEDELRAYHAAHRERYRAAADTTEVLPFETVREQVRAHWIAEREAARFDSLVTRLKGRYRIVYHDEALLRLPLNVR